MYNQLVAGFVTCPLISSHATPHCHYGSNSRRCRRSCGEGRFGHPGKLFPYIHLYSSTTDRVSSLTSQHSCPMIKTQGRLRQKLYWRASKTRVSSTSRIMVYPRLHSAVFSRIVRAFLHDLQIRKMLSHGTQQLLIVGIPRKAVKSLFHWTKLAPRRNCARLSLI